MCVSVRVFVCVPLCFEMPQSGVRFRSDFDRNTHTTHTYTMQTKPTNIPVPVERHNVFMQAVFFVRVRVLAASARGAVGPGKGEQRMHRGFLHKQVDQLGGNVGQPHKELDRNVLAAVATYNGACV